MTTPRKKLVPPNGAKKILLHSCCAPCAGDVMMSLLASKIQFTIFFYNPNIHPNNEYEIRKQENIRFANKMKIAFVDADYERDLWFKRIKGLESEPERGLRCTQCFDMRFEYTARFAHLHGYKVFTSTLGISRWKDMKQINMAGMRAALNFPGLIYWTYNWRKGGGAQRMYEIAKQENFYKQEYCGCVYSLRDTNLWRKEKDQPRIERGINYYGQEALDDEDDVSPEPRVKEYI